MNFQYIQCSLFDIVTLFLPQFAPSSPAVSTPSSDSTTGSPWTPWPPSAARCTPPSSHQASPPITRCSLSSRCAPPSEEPSSACCLTTSGRSSSTCTTPTEVGDGAGRESHRAKRFQEMFEPLYIAAVQQGWQRRDLPPNTPLKSLDCKHRTVPRSNVFATCKCRNRLSSST